MASTLCSSLSTRSATSIWLIGQPEPSLPSNVLPSTGDVLKHFLYFQKHLKETNSTSANLTADNLMKIWSRARVPTTYRPHIVCRIKSIANEYNLIKKNKNRKNEAQKNRQDSFIDKMLKLIDIAHQDAEKLNRIE